MSQEKMLVAIAGLPGASKTWSTREALRSPELSNRAAVISIGGILRDINAGLQDSLFTEEVRRESKKLSRGACVPGSVAKAILQEALPKYADKQLLLTDGFPRTEAQAYELEKIADRAGRTLTGVILFRLSSETSQQRQLERRQRVGEGAITEGMIAKRDFEFHTFTMPALNYLQEVQGLPLHVIDAEQSKVDTAEQVARVVRSITE